MRTIQTTTGLREDWTDGLQERLAADRAAAPADPALKLALLPPMEQQLRDWSAHKQEFEFVISRLAPRIRAVNDDLSVLRKSKAQLDEAIASGKIAAPRGKGAEHSEVRSLRLKIERLEYDLGQLTRRMESAKARIGNIDKLREEFLERNGDKLEALRKLDKALDVVRPKNTFTLDIRP